MNKHTTNKDLRKRYKQANRELLKWYCAPDRTTENFLAAVLLVEDASILLNGIFGTGKTQLVHLVKRIFFANQEGNGYDFGDVTCHQEQSPFDVNFHLDLGRYSQGEEVVHPRAMITSRLKFVNEVQRASTSVCNGLLSLLSEKFVLHRDQRFMSPSYLCFLDRNPIDSGSNEIPGAFLDRIDYSLTLSRSKSHDLVRLQEQIESHSGNFAHNISDLDVQSHFTADEMQELWQDVAKITLGPEERRLVSLIASYLQACTYTERSRLHSDYDLPCGTCSYRNEACSKLQQIPGTRFSLSMIKLAKAHAWLRKSMCVEAIDLFYTLPFVLSHRLSLKPEVIKAACNEHAWVTEELYAKLLQPKIARWQQAASIKLNSPDLIQELRPLAETDLALLELLDA